MTRVCFVVDGEVEVTLGLLSSFTESLRHGVEEEGVDHMLFLRFLLLNNTILDLLHNVFAFFMSLCLETC